MSKYKSLRQFSVPDGKDENGRQKMKEFFKGEVYEVSERLVRQLGRTYFVPYVEPKKKPTRKPKGEKKPDIRTR